MAINNIEIEAIQKPLTIEDVRTHFVDPRNPASAEDLAVITGDTVRVMSQIYSTGGQVDQMTPNFRDWLEGRIPNMSELEALTGEVLKMEAETRRFDEGFMGQIHPQGNKVGIIANLIAAYMNNNLIVEEVSQMETLMEKESIRWLAEMFGYNPDLAGGNIVTGGTEANDTALRVAKGKFLDSIGLKKNVIRRIKEPVQMYALTSRWRHYSIDKICDALDIGLVTMPSDNFKIDLQATEHAIKVFKRLEKEKEMHLIAVVGLAGETETGMVDDLRGLAEISRKHGIYYHVDAAYGGPFVLSRAKELFEGIQDADSITVDPHKMLYTPYPAGAIIFRDAKDQDYLHTNTRYLGKVASTPSGSRSSAGAIGTFATIKDLRREGLEVLLNYTLDLADTAHDWVMESGILKPIHDPELNTMLIGLANEAKTQAAQRGIVGEKYDDMIRQVKKELDNRRSRNPYVSYNSEVDGGRSVFRFIGVHPYTTKADVISTLERVEETVCEKIGINQ